MTPSDLTYHFVWGIDMKKKEVFTLINTTHTSELEGLMIPAKLKIRKKEYESHSNL